MRHLINIVNTLADMVYLVVEEKSNVQKMKLITYNPVHHDYIALGKPEGNAFSDGKKLKV